MNKIRYFALLLFALLQMEVNAQTFHFVSMFDTNDKKIGKGMNAERMLITNEMQTIAGYLEEFGYDSEFSEYYGNNCGKTPLMQAINNLNVGSEDIVLFYYGGHGTRAYNNSEDRFPQMCLGERSTMNYVPSSLVKNMIAKKNPRLAVILTGCCNKEDANVTIKSIVAQSQGYTSQSGVNKEAFKQLFLQSKGVVQLTSSKAGEYSWCNDKGSFFCLALLDVFSGIGRGEVTPDWNSVCKTVKGLVSSLNIHTQEGYVKQNPDYEITTSISDIPRTDKDKTTIKRRVNNVNYDLAQDIEQLLDKSRSSDARLQLVPSILARHFSNGAKVLTLGRDMNTVVDYEDAETFLRRIAISPYIKQINIVEQENGKSKLVRVHEVRIR